MSRQLLLMFVEEADRLSKEGKLLEATVSLKNARACRAINRKTEREIHQVIVALLLEYRFRERSK